MCYVNVRLGSLVCSMLALTAPAVLRWVYMVIVFLSPYLKGSIVLEVKLSSGINGHSITSLHPQRACPVVIKIKASRLG